MKRTPRATQPARAPNPTFPGFVVEDIPHQPLSFQSFPHSFDIENSHQHPSTAVFPGDYALFGKIPGVGVQNSISRGRR
jgi:hypothetical protein